MLLHDLQIKVSNLLRLVNGRVAEEDQLRSFIDNLVAIQTPREIGVHCLNGSSCNVYATDECNVVGEVKISGSGQGNTLIIDNRSKVQSIFAKLTFHGNGCLSAISNSLGRRVNLQHVSFRGSEQLFYWGLGSSAVAASIEIEGEGSVIAIGDDCLVSSGVWLRNHDMHSLVHAETHERIRVDGVDTIIEQHVWIGQDVLILRCEHIGYGSIIGAKALVVKDVPPKCIVGGVPARLLSENRTWGRRTSGPSPTELKTLALLNAFKS